MFGISFLEFAVICGLAFLVLGPDKLPAVARKLGKLSGELRRASDGLRREFYSAVYEPTEEELAAAKRELANLRSSINLENLHPECPDTKRILAEKSANSVPENTQVGAETASSLPATAPSTVTGDAAATANTVATVMTTTPSSTINETVKS